ncbi:hypothetical protein BD780_001615 [Clostridium tetanomorphum]|uniref:DUF7021 domain-containing protein n=1 Tax=Clostridium tetanomorphum TaxID=1553 RepID=A0A923J0Z1_CLOTT|nr:hypothetical protein [Clostridium tetanomorphum]KAJ52689.1 hypothetical protein CTM_06876 [Clostridium tetanomorphum DSM 665]MBC2396758.1 hypothetical protein [Clostridium tetanomorphum]MBP1863282.1 hypothetical protein [Clostridium tetanomorphum]NRS84390.1 hypothetical protein [Clostridium tetanomorphum]NRZ97605.1 hypothetical protein [Clostridium tetanomorphum]
MSKLNEKSKFENRFTDNIIEVAAVTGALGVGAGKAGGDMFRGHSIIVSGNINGDITSAEIAG